MKKILVCSTDVMMFLFLVPHVRKLISDGFSVDVACSYADEYIQEDYRRKILESLPDGCTFFSISSVRSPFSFKNFKAYRQLRDVILNGNYDLVWANEPVVGVLSRLAARKVRKSGTKVVYLVHGFHFFKGSPFVNWFFYPFEKICSYFTDWIITINKADYGFSRKNFSVKTEYIQGIGFPHAKFSTPSAVDVSAKRNEFGFCIDDIIILAVGELLPRKNHVAAIKALAGVRNESVKLLICGIGGLQHELENLAVNLGVSDRVVFAGLRYDIPEILKVADIFIHPSLREGLGMAPLEAMASGLPIITSNVQGITDYSVNETTGYVCDPHDIGCYIGAINSLLDSAEKRNKIGQLNIGNARPFDISNSLISLSRIINEILSK